MSRHYTSKAPKVEVACAMSHSARGRENGLIFSHASGRSGGNIHTGQPSSRPKPIWRCHSPSCSRRTAVAVTQSDGTAGGDLGQRNCTASSYHFTLSKSGEVGSPWQLPGCTPHCHPAGNSRETGPCQPQSGQGAKQAGMSWIGLPQPSSRIGCAAKLHRNPPTADLLGASRVLRPQRGSVDKSRPISSLPADFPDLFRKISQLTGVLPAHKPMVYSALQV
mmetsp:Transcript_15719/g.27683  ORF Transcript_15719/g.27683 Transcript_15719/m.27683 type:complete len:221 (+) Transcript_15719:1680-2342(+)